VHDARSLFVEQADVRKVVEQAVDQGALGQPGRRMRGQARGLVQHGQVGVLEEQVQGPGLGGQLPGAVLAGEFQGLGPAQAQVGPGAGLPVHQGPARADPVLDLLPGQAFGGQLPGPELIQPQPGVLGHGRALPTAFFDHGPKIHGNPLKAKRFRHEPGKPGAPA